MIAINEPAIFGNEISNLKKCINKKWLSSYGKFPKLFENKIKKKINSKYAVSCNSGTSALQIAISLLCKKNEEIIVPTITFVATINSIIYNNCSPIFLDVDDSYNIDAEQVVRFLNEETYLKNKKCYNKKTNKIISALIIVCVWGGKPEYEKLVNICKKKNIKIIEDATEALGSKITRGRFAHKFLGTIGDVGCLSFNGNKVITSGGGGMLLLKKKNLDKKARYYISQCKDNTELFIHNDVGYNFSLSNLNAAFGLAQLKYLDKIISKKKKIFLTYKFQLHKLKKFSFFNFSPKIKSNYWMNMIRTKKNKYHYKRKLLLEFKKAGIEARSVWYPNHIQKPFLKYQRYHISNANNIFKSSICLPSSYSLTKQDQLKVIKIIKKLDV